MRKPSKVELQRRQAKRAILAVLDAGPLTCAEIAAEVGRPERETRSLLNMLVGRDVILHRQNDGRYELWRHVVARMRTGETPRATVRPRLDARGRVIA